MQAIKSAEVEVQGNLGGQKVAMSLDENSTNYLMTVLIDLYSDPELAVLREYSTNAYDSHVAAGQTRPIEVTLPTRFDPYLKIRDYGVGLSVQEITDIYSKYGASTKRNTNDQVGMLGLGCKSGLTYTPNFNLVSIQNGVKVNVSISRNDDGGGMMNILDTVSTTDPDGVEIIIPAKFYNQFAYKAERFFRFWEPGTVLIDGEPPKFYPGMKLDDSITIIDENNNYVVMGNVAYPVDSKYSAGVNFVARVPIGSIHFTPSREHLHYTKLTQETLNKIVNAVKENLKNKVAEEIRSAKNHAEALKIFEKWRIYAPNAIGNARDYKYKGEQLPKGFTLTFWKYSSNSYYGTTCRKYTDIVLEWWTISKSTLIVGFSGTEITRTHKAKMRRYAADNGLSDSFIITDKKFGYPWIKDFVSWDDIAAVKLSKPKGPAVPRPTEKYQIIEGGYKKHVNTFDQSKGITYYSDSEFDVRNDKLFDFQRLICQYFEDKYTIIRIGLNRQKKFQHDYPKAVKLKALIDARRSEIEKAIGESEFMVHWKNSLNYSVVRALQNFRKNEINDPEFKRLLDVIKAQPTEIMSTQRAFDNFCSIAGVGKTHVDIPKFIDNVFVNYPLLSLVGHLTAEQKADMVDYINRKYERKTNAI